MAKRPWTEHPKVLALRHRSAVVNTAVRMIDDYRVRRLGRNAALIAHYGFLSVFPLYLAFATIIGLVLEDRPELAEDIIDSALNRIPIIGQQIAQAPEELGGDVRVLVVGLLISLWAGMRAFNVIQGALDDVRDIPFDERRSAVATRLWSLAGIAVVGTAQVVTAILTGMVGAAEIELVQRLGLLLAAVIVNGGVLALNYHWLCSRPPPWRTLWPGALFGGIGFAGLQVLGATLMSRYIANASAVYGTFASVIALLAWMSLHALVALLGAELNRVLPARRLPLSEELGG